ncbi:hypothetical protein [Metabacillus litoralis]|uniref:hypothetical protein n=1 Tax=Metabacillus litoralis TaxID=152268 RepID=UPI002041B51F|nr:hypothetical protein [Metabacillus litoralis]MCM3162713.1 hypothetical protein [Metabacillus litoralis]
MENKVKPWFECAVDQLSSPSKQIFIGQLTIIKLNSKVAEEKNEIQVEIKRLSSVEGDKLFEGYLKNYIVKRRGWTLNLDGSIKEFEYLYREPKQPLLKRLEHWYVKRAMGSVARKFGEDINKK